jgi:serine/threonine-protein kinase
LPRALAASMAVPFVVMAVAGSGEGAAVAATILSIPCFAAVAYLVALLLREYRAGGPHERFAVRMIGIAFSSVGIFVIPDVWARSGRPAIAGGCLGVGLGLVIYALLQSALLATDHVRSLREAESRVRELESQRREVEHLNEELRRQVAERSRELTEALAKTEGSVAPAVLEMGDTFDGRYRVTRALGRGGMGTVYEVERARDGRKLALKVVTGAMSAKQAARFAREAEIGARLRHENLVSIVDVGIAAGATPFLVMELVQGGSLEDRRGRFGEAKWALPIVRQVAAGLAELHANRVVHRDLKPGNVLLVDGDGATIPLAKISDFGISRFGAIDASTDVDVEGGTLDAAAGAATPTDLTETGALMGTPVYMPPEAFFGPARHPSADLFSLGVLAYEALTGRSPFALPPVLLLRSRQPIPTPAPLDGIGAGVAAVVLACLRVDPSERPRAREVAEALSRVAGGSHATPSAARR